MFRLKRRLALALPFGAMLAPLARVFGAEPPPQPVDAGPITLPKDIVWETNNDEPLIGSEKAIRGGRLTLGWPEYPLTLRLLGPNNNGSFATWTRAFSGMSLIGMHPVTD